MSPVLLLHIGAGGVGIGSGALALAVPKGSRPHRASGSAFVIAMLIMALSATLLAVALGDWANLPGGLFAAYLVATGWAAITPGRRLGGLAEQAALVLGGGAAASALLLVFQADASATGLINGKPAPLFAAFAGLAAFALLFDLNAMRLPTLSRRRQLGRHIWRMSTALFLGSGSFFMGQQKVMPPWVQGSPFLPALAVAPLLIMLYWLARTGLRRGPPLGPTAS